MIKQYILNVLVGLDQFTNALFGGSPEETISSRAGKGQKEGKRWACLLCRFLDYLQKDHCIRSIEPDEGSDAVIKD